VYGCPDDVARFLFFSRASLEFLAWAKKVPDALHIHDWQVGRLTPASTWICSP
jgi:starch synthase